MPRTCTICTHLQRNEIEAALLTGTSLRDIGRQFETGKDALARHKSVCIAQSLSKAQNASEVVNADNLLAELKRHAARLHLLSDACHEWLTDPTDPAKYTLEPRSSEISVVYSVPTEDGKPTRKKAKLSDLLAEVETKTGASVERWETKHADPRELVLKTYDRIQGQLELVAKLLGELSDAPTISFNVTINHLQTVIVQALLPFPEARLAVAQALKESNL